MASSNMAGCAVVFVMLGGTVGALLNKGIASRSILSASAENNARALTLQQFIKRKLWDFTDADILQSHGITSIFLPHAAYPSICFQ
jgi:hypothetical protein